MRVPRPIRPFAVAPRPTDSLMSGCRVTLVASVAIALCLPASASPAQPQAPAACAVTGTITAGQIPLPGVALTLTPSTGPDAKTIAGSTGPDGTFELPVPGPGEYVLKGELVAFASVERTITLTPDACRAQVTLSTTLASRQPKPAAEAHASDGATNAPPPTRPTAPAQSGTVQAEPGHKPPADAGASSRGRLSFRV